MPIMIFWDGAVVGKSWARRVGQRTKTRVTPKKGHQSNLRQLHEAALVAKGRGKMCQDMLITLL